MAIDNDAQRFRDALLASPELQARLGVFENPAQFEAEARLIAAELGLDPVSAMREASAHDARGISRAHGAPVLLNGWPQIGWVPVRPAPGQAEPALDWAWFGDRRLSEPFFEDSVRRMASRPLSRAYRTRTNLDALIAGAAQEETLTPDGMIFHMSRCGSTLVAQMLAAVPHHVVASEAAPIDAIVQWAIGSGVPLDRQVAALRAVVAAIGRKRTSDARRYFIKLDAWNILALPLFRAAFPDTPWIFLYRDPEEVMVSHLQMPGLHFATGFGSGDGGAGHDRTASIEDRGAVVLARYLDAAVEHIVLGGGMLVNYANLRAAIESVIPDHFGFVPDAGERAAMTDATQRNSKLPDQTYRDDVEQKRAAVTPAIQAAVARHLRAPYDRVEALRRSVAANGAATR